jgi:dGTPase
VAEDLRTDEEHDCDRILYSSAFRRLAGVTQVVAVDEIQLFHNRLTHTIKVAQLSRRLAQDLGRDPAYKRARDSIGGVNEAAAEAAALAHDLGHPPFGHIAEAVLRRRCDAAGADGFEGNAQSFRIVTKLARRASDQPGLGLHPRTLRGILKYPWLRGPEPTGSASKEAKLKYRKWGAYLSEEAEFTRVMEAIPGNCQSTEASIMDWCDDISYALHDLEDFFRVNLIPLDRIGNLSQDDEALAFLALAAHELERNPDYDSAEAKSALQRLRGFFPAGPYHGTHEDRHDLHTMTSTLIGAYLKSVSLRTNAPTVRVTKAARHEVMLLKQLTWQYVVNNPSLATIQEGQMAVIDTVFTILTRWLEKEKEQGVTHRLPGRLRSLDQALHDDEAAMDVLSDAPARHARVVADYICELTEDQVLDLYRRLCGSASKSVLDGWVRW